MITTTTGLHGNHLMDSVTTRARHRPHQVGQYPVLLGPYDLLDTAELGEVKECATGTAFGGAIMAIIKQGSSASVLECW